MKNLLKPLITAEKESDPFDEINWVSRDAVIKDKDGKVIFEQRDVEFPDFFSQTAVNIVTQKYFRGRLDTLGRESSLKQAINRVSNTITQWGYEQEYFSAPEAEVFERRLRRLLVNQKLAFNSPVWFNVGIEEKPQCSACFIQSVEDSMESILDLAKSEGMLFKGGSGTGSNLSTLRSSKEHLEGGGLSSGPVSFMRGFDAFAGAIKSGGKTRRAAKMVILDVDHPDIIDFIECKAEEERRAKALIEAGFEKEFNAKGTVYDSVGYQNANHSVRVSDAFMHAVENDLEWSTATVLDGSTVETFRARDVLRRIATAAHECGDPGMQFDCTINEWNPCINTARINASNPCGEYVFLDDSACNLASLNLRRFQREDGTFDVQAYEEAIEIAILAMEIIVDSASYPTPKIADNSHKFRPLGLGYANLGALLMSYGIPYDSDEGRDLAAALTSLMTARAYKTSKTLAELKGPFEGFKENRTCFMYVMRMHSLADTHLDTFRSVGDSHVLGTTVQNILERSQYLWLDICSPNSTFRNAQISLLAPTGTIAFLMDCDTTGGEPSISLIRHKKLVGGGSITTTSDSIRPALLALGYTNSQITTIMDYVQTAGDVVGAPELKEEHLPVFDCAFPGPSGRCITPMGHIKMMAAIQPFLSGAISKTVNLPSDCTVEDIENIYIEGWKLHLKAIAVYRDGCKGSQPLSSKKPESIDGTIASKAASTQTTEPYRRKLPDERPSLTHKYTIGGHEGYVTVGLYEDTNQPGELFTKMAKEGSVVSGLMDAFSTAISLCLQYGVPLEKLCDKFIGTQFEPSGFTGRSDIPIATSVLDYIFRWLRSKYLASTNEGDTIVLSNTDRDAFLEHLSNPPPPNDHLKAVLRDHKSTVVSSEHTCSNCGAFMIPNGSCHRCPNCGETSGCS